MINSQDITRLQEVSKTLLPTLYMRSLETKRTNGIIQDQKSVEIVNQIDYDFSLHDSDFSQAIIAIRTKVIDELVKNILDQYPEITIVSLGTGLCTRFFRLDNGMVNWIGIDLPRVKPVWDSLIGESERSQFLAYSVLDFNWIEAVKKIAPGKVLFIAEGILMFFSEAEVKQLLMMLKANFSGCELIFDALGEFLAKNSRLNSGELGIQASYQWGIKNLKSMETWAAGIELRHQCYYLDQHKNRLGWIGLLSYLPMLRRQIKIGHLRFVAA